MAAASRQSADPSHRNVGAAAWAHNRWPTIGLYAGAGVGLVLGIVRLAGLWKTLLFTVALAVGGLIVGYLLARIIYRKTNWDPPLS